MKPSRVIEALKVLIKAKRPGFLWGPPGVGKSDVVRQVAEELKYKLVDVRALLLDPVDLRGIPTVSDDGETRWAPPSFLPKGKGKYIVFLDELNAAPPLVQAACYQLVLDRKIGEYELPENAIVIAAGNRETDRAVVSRMPSALANRFVHIDFDVDMEDWSKWAVQNGVQTEVMAFLRYRPELLHKFDPKRNDKAFPTPRSWEFTSQMIAAAGNDLEYDLISGVVGEGAATELIGFLRIFRDLPDPDLVLKAPDKADIPSDPAILYAICGAIAHRADEKNIAAVVKYANRLPTEFSVLLLRDVLNRDESLAQTREFVEWVAAHGDVFMG